MSDKTYIEDSTLHGNYQFVTLSEIISNLEVMGTDSDSYLKNTERSTLLYYTRQAIKELSRSLSTEIKKLEVRIGQDLKFILPEDFVDYAKISLINKNGKLQPLSINHNINVAKAYLQNEQNEIVYDTEDNIQFIDKSNTYAKPYNSTSSNSSGCNAKSSNASVADFILDRGRRSIAFSSSMLNQIMVIDYVSDGLEEIDVKGENEITIHKHIEMAIMDYVYLKVVEKRKNVPANEKFRANRRFEKSRHQALLKAAKINGKTVGNIIRK